MVPLVFCGSAMSRVERGQRCARGREATGSHDVAHVRGGATVAGEAHRRLNVPVRVGQGGVVGAAGEWTSRGRSWSEPDWIRQPGEHGTIQRAAIGVPPGRAGRAPARRVEPSDGRSWSSGGTRGRRASGRCPRGPIPGMQIRGSGAAQRSRDQRHRVELGVHVRARHEGLELGVGQDDALAIVDRRVLWELNPLRHVLGEHLVAPELSEHLRDVDLDLRYRAARLPRRQAPGVRRRAPRRDCRWIESRAAWNWRRYSRMP